MRAKIYKRAHDVTFARAAIADLELEEAELINRLRSTQEKQRLACVGGKEGGWGLGVVCDACGCRYSKLESALQL